MLSLTISSAVKREISRLKASILSLSQRSSSLLSVTFDIINYSNAAFPATGGSLAAKTIALVWPPTATFAIVEVYSSADLTYTRTANTAPVVINMNQFVTDPGVTAFRQQPSYPQQLIASNNVTALTLPLGSSFLKVILGDRSVTSLTLQTSMAVFGATGDLTLRQSHPFVSVFVYYYTGATTIT
jgi:hypothetical protein